jgi:hypothetical protein
VLKNIKRRFNKKTQEVVLKEFNITLNVEDAYFSRENIRIDLKRLFSDHYVSSTVLFCRDYNLRIINPDDIISIKRGAFNLKSVAL